jgi:hypothetical protein
VPDSTLSAINRFYDLVDDGVEKIDHVLNRDKHIAAPREEHRAKRTEIHGKVIEAKTASRPAKSAAPSSSTALARKPHYYIVESIAGGVTRYVVTDGGSARAECTSRALAEKLLRALEAA